MSSVNKVILVGNLGRDPEIRTFPNGDQVCNATLATTDKWKDKTSGEPREATEWHRLQFTGRLAEIAGQYLKKGMQVYVEGQIRTRKYNDKDGVEKYATDIRVDQMQMLGSKNGSAPAAGDGDEAGAAAAPAASKASAAPARAPAASPAAAPKSSSGFDDMDDDIPF